MVAVLEGPHLARHESYGMRYRFAGIFRYRGKLFITKERKVGGPRCVVMPPIELAPDAEIEEIGTEVLSALDAFEESSEKITPEQWSRLNKEYMEFVGARSVAAFERAKSEVTIRHDTSTDVYVLFAKSGKEVELQSPTKVQLAENIVRLLE